MNNCPHCSAVDIEVVVDRSGSMGRFVADTIGSYNAWLAQQKALPGAANLTLTLFDDEVTTFPTTTLEAAEPLDEARYAIRGSTALNDAIGLALNRLTARNPAKAILVILTDGEENMSRQFSTRQIKQMIEKAQGRGWQVVYLSADINAFQHGDAYGVLRSHTFQVKASGAGIRSAMGTATTLNTSYRSSVSLPAADNTNWFATSLAAQAATGPAFDPLPSTVDTSPSCDPSPSYSSDSGSYDSSSSVDSGSCDAGSF